MSWQFEGKIVKEREKFYIFPQKSVFLLFEQGAHIFILHWGLKIV